MPVQVVLVGCGNMGYAMLEGWLGSGRLEAAETIVVEPVDALRDRAATLGVTVHADASQLPSDMAPRLVVFAVKPQVILDVIPAYAGLAGATTYLSVAAGTQIAAFQEALGAEAAIIRCMPNTPAAIGKGMMVTVDNGKVDAATNEFVEALLASNGRVATIPDEGLMDAVTAVSGSGPAYIFHFIECLTAAGETAGLSPQTAKLLAMQTVFGAAALAAESGTEPGELRRQVTSPNGTTAAALSVFMDDDRLKTLVTEAVDAARRRSIELGA